MWRLVWGQLRFRWGRAVASLVAVSFAVGSFSLLGSAARGQRLEAVGTVKANYRAGYDLLVRPAGASAASAGVLAGGETASGDGGITQAQWRRVLGLSGVSVAAPLAVGGYVMQTVQVRVDLTPYLRTSVTNQVLRVVPSWTSDDGLTRLTDGALYLFATDDQLTADPADPGALLRVAANGKETAVCQGPVGVNGADGLKPANRETGRCGSTYPGSKLASDVFVDYAVPMLVAAVDPVQEAKLDGLNSAVVSGRYLDAGDTRPATGEIPVLAASTPQLDEQLHLSVERLPQGQVEAQMASGLSWDNALAGLDAQRGTPAASRTITAQQEYPSLLAALQQQSGDGSNLAPAAQDYWTVGRPQQTGSAAAGSLREEAQQPGLTDWGPTASHFPGNNPLPLELSDTAVRTVTGHGSDNDAITTWPVLSGVGVFDASKVAAGPVLAGDPVGVYAASGVRGADAASRAALGGGVLGPSANIGGPVGQRPQLLTTFGGLAQLRRGPYEGLSAAQGVNAAAPIDSIRVRVAGAVGMDGSSRRQVDAVADEIRRATGLRVDFMGGSSRTTEPVAVPAGRYGRPALVVGLPFTREGVAGAVASAVDRKSVVLAVLVLVACALAVANATGAEIRTRRTELGVLSCLGWPRGRLFRLVFVEAAGLGVGAGVVGAGWAAGFAPLLGVHLRLLYVGLAVPAALVLTLAAAGVPAWRVSRVAPAAAVRPAVSAVRGGVRCAGRRV